IGGDGFWLVREPSGKVTALMGAGPAGAKATARLYRDAGYDTIPPRGPLAALTVPGAIGAWILALDGATAHRGRLPLDVLLSAAIKHAREGYKVTRSQSALTKDKLPEMDAAVGFREAFLIDGKPPELGATLKQTGLAATFEQLVHAGLEDFYRGDVGREIAADLERIGSPVTRADLENYRAVAREPLKVNVSAGRLYNTPPSTQGLASLMILALFDRLRVEKAESFEHIHGLVEATKRAFRVRDKFVTDPGQLDGDPARFLDTKFLDLEATKIDRAKAARWPASYGEGDTVWMGAADSSGLVVSYIQSLYWEFGSGCVLPATGILMQNRGASFSLDPKAANPLAPGRKPFHTLNPALAALKDGRVMAYGTMGGDGQPQSQAAVFTRHITYGQPLDVALDAPRWLLGRTWGSPHTNLRMESRFDGNLIDRLMSAGHDIDVLSESYSDTMGHAGAAIWYADGPCEAAHDPRADGGAAGA
ncbi:MAG: gamma-glutamyltransferase, partial [Pseudolabrys sp.]|nr:gamma-glutamyltransferase [Pseudolabrys sp.]